MCIYTVYGNTASSESIQTLFFGQFIGLKFIIDQVDFLAISLELENQFTHGKVNYLDMISKKSCENNV